MSNTHTFELPASVADRLVNIVGESSALRSDAERDQYRDPFWYAKDRSYDSSLVLFPETREQVQEIARVANEAGVPLWPTSQGRNNGYGGPSPRVKGSVLVGLKHMNKVLHIDRELAYAVVEPGVTWAQLRQELDATGHEDLWFSIPDLSWGSVIGNSLDNGLTYGPYGSDFQKICGMEVVLADGSLLRTGLGAQPGNESWHLYTRGYGPVLDPLFIQSNYGIVTQVGIWLMRRPEAYAPLFLSVKRHEQLGDVIDLFRELRLDGIVRGVPSIQNFVVMSAQFDQTRELYLRADPALPEAELDRIADESGIGRWGARTAVWGDRAVVESHRQKILDAWEQIEGSHVVSDRVWEADEWGEMTSFVDKVQAGIPNMDITGATPSSAGHADFSPILPLRSSSVVEAVNWIRDAIISEVGNNHCCALYLPNDRTCIAVNSVTFDVTKEEVTEKVYQAMKNLVVKAGERGLVEYRAHVDLMDLVADQLSFNDHAYGKFVNKIKDAVDPNGILAPGRHGVWPSRFSPR